MKVKKGKTRLTKAEYARYLEAMKEHAIDYIIRGLEK